MSNVTANQHYIWQHYLRAWCAPKKLWCKRIGQPEPFDTTPRNVGAQRYFYEFPELTIDDLDYLHAVIAQSNNEALRDLNLGWIESFQKTFKFRSRLDGLELDSELRTTIEVKLREIERTMGELFHGDTENRAIPIIDALRRQDVTFYVENDGWMTFIDYISHQYFRTSKIRSAMLNLPNISRHEPRRTWPIESFIYATNLASSFVRQRHDYRIVLLQNKSDIPFITGDQPVINLVGADVEEVDLYYPLQPDLAMLFTANQKTYPIGKMEIGRIAVESYNHRIYVKSDTQIYGNDPLYLKSLAALPKDGIV